MSSVFLSRHAFYNNLHKQAVTLIAYAVDFLLRHPEISNYFDTYSLQAVDFSRRALSRWSNLMFCTQFLLECKNKCLHLYHVAIWSDDLYDVFDGFVTVYSFFNPNLNFFSHGKENEKSES